MYKYIVVFNSFWKFFYYMNYIKIYNMYKNFIVLLVVELFFRMYVFKFDCYINNDYLYFVMVIEILVLVFVIFYMVKEVKKIKE